jgi:hypothetical protein
MITTCPVKISKFYLIFLILGHIARRESLDKVVHPIANCCGKFSPDDEVKNDHFVVGYFVNRCLC